MHNIVIIGSSEIVDSHIRVLKKLKFNILAICTTNINSKNIIKLSRTHKIKNVFTKISNLFEFLKDENNFVFLLAPRIKDTENILLKCLKFKKKIFIEKPISISHSFIKNLKNHKKNIFVGYNRIFYKNVIEVSKMLTTKKNLFIEASCSENSKKDILTNSCHMISILLRLFGDIKFSNIIRKKNFIIAIGKTKKLNFITIKFNFQSSENFYLKIIDKKKVFLFKPIENLSIYDGLIKVKKKKLNFYEPSLKKKINEFKINKFKPGFLQQAIFFKKFILNKIIIDNDVIFAYKVMKICKKIHG